MSTATGTRCPKLLYSFPSKCSHSVCLHSPSHRALTTPEEGKTWTLCYFIQVSLPTGPCGQSSDPILGMVLVQGTGLSLSQGIWRCGGLESFVRPPKVWWTLLKTLVYRSSQRPDRADCTTCQPDGQGAYRHKSFLRVGTTSFLFTIPIIWLLPSKG